MKTKTLTIALLPLALLTAGLAFATHAQDGAAPPAAEASPLAPVEDARADALRPVDDAPDGRVQPLRPTFDAATWKAELSQPDFEARRRAMRDLAREARNSAGARAALEEWAASEDACLAWTAWLTLEEARDAGRARPLSPFGGAPFGTRGADPFDRWFGGGAFGGLDPFGGDPFEVRDLMRDLRESLDRMPGASGSGRGLSIESGPDGVRVERRTIEDGEEVIETFEAESMEELLELHPELRDEMSMRPLSPGEDARSLLDRLQRELGVPDAALSPGEVRTDVLGVMMREAGAWQGRVDGLEPGTGLLVQNVLPGTIAEAVGLRAGDVVATLNGVLLRTAEDVREVLAARAADAPITVEWFDRSGARRSRTWTP